MHHVVTIDEENVTGEDGVWYRHMTCTCEWTGEADVLRAHAKAQHHLVYTHGRGRIMYAGSAVEV